MFTYNNYRSYLKDYYTSKKQKPGFSYESFSRSLGIKSGNYLKLVIDGKRSLTLENIHGFARVIGLTGEELNYFESLVLMNQTEDERIRRYYKGRLEELRANKRSAE